MIVYKEKGEGLHKELSRRKFYLIANTNDQAFDSEGNQSAEIDTAVQAIIDNYDPLPEAKAEAKARIIKEAGKRVHAIYPFIDPDKDDIIGFWNYTIDMYSGSFPLPPRLKAFKDIHDSAVTAIASVNSMTDWQAVDAYDATGW